MKKSLCVGCAVLTSVVFFVIPTLSEAKGRDLALLSGPSVGSLQRSFELTYQVRLADLPSQGRQLRVWIPLATSNEHQKIRRRVIESPVRYRITKDPEYGNDILFLQLRSPLPQELKLAVRYAADVQGKSLQLSPRPVHQAVVRDCCGNLHLKSDSYMVVNDQVRDLAGRITAGARTPLERARRIYRYVVERMTYEKETPGWGNGDTLRACEVGRGNCTDFHSMFISLARASGIPAQFQIGLPVPAQADGEIPGYHCWAQFHLPEVGWVPVDASEAWKDRKKYDYFFGSYDPNRLALTLGRDIRLVPSPRENDRQNIFFFPYAELDGKSVAKDKIETKFRFRDLEKGEGEKNA